MKNLRYFQSDFADNYSLNLCTNDISRIEKHIKEALGEEETWPSEVKEKIILHGTMHHEKSSQGFSQMYTTKPCYQTCLHWPALAQHTSFPVCRYEHLLNWWKCSNKIGQDLVTMAYLAYRLSNLPALASPCTTYFNGILRNSISITFLWFSIFLSLHIFLILW